MVRLLIELALVLVAWFGVLVIMLLVVGWVRLLCAKSYQYEQPLRDIAYLKKGDIILTGRQSILDSWFIQLANVLTRKLKHRFWTHAAIYQGNGRLWEAQPAPRGIIERDLEDYIKGGFYIRAFRHRYIKDETMIDQVIQWCAAQKGDGYDLRGTIFYGLSVLTPVGFNFIFDNAAIAKLCHVENNYFCSELIVEAFEQTGYPISPFDGWRVKPTDFISNPLLEEVAVPGN